MEALAKAEAESGGSLHAAALAENLATTVRKLASAVPGPEKRTLTVEVLAEARDLATRVGDESNLALDPDLNSYYLQNIVVKRMPTMLSQMGELQSLVINLPSGDAAQVRPLLLAGMIRSGIEEIERDVDERSCNIFWSSHLRLGPRTASFAD